MARFAEPSHSTLRRYLIPSEYKKASLVYTKDALKREFTQRHNAHYRLTCTSPAEEGISKKGVLAGTLLSIHWRVPFGAMSLGSRTHGPA